MHPAKQPIPGVNGENVVRCGATPVVTATIALLCPLVRRGRKHLEQLASKIVAPSRRGRHPDPGRWRHSTSLARRHMSEPPEGRHEIDA